MGPSPLNPFYRPRLAAYVVSMNVEKSLTLCSAIESLSGRAAKLARELRSQVATRGATRLRKVAPKGKTTERILRLLEQEPTRVFDALLLAVALPDVNMATLRSTLAQLKQKGLITSPRRGSYQWRS